MHNYRIIGTLLIISMVTFLYIGCRPNGKHLSEEDKKVIVDVTVGGKVWKVDPNLSYRATGVWTNPEPRSLTDTEKTRLQKIQAEIQNCETQLDELYKESNFLQRIEQPEIKIRYTFGKPHHLSSDGIVDFGEFPMEIENGEVQMEMGSPNQTHSE